MGSSSSSRHRPASLGSFILLGFVVFGSGCRIWYTDAVRAEYTAPPMESTASIGEELQAAPVNSLQFFVSQRVILERVVASRSDKVARGHIRVRKGRLIDRVVIRAGTPGVATNWGADWVDVSFEKGSAMRFRLASARSPEHPGQISEDDRYLLETEGRGAQATLEFGGASYNVVGGWSAGLRVKQLTRKRQQWKRKVLRGRRL